MKTTSLSSEQINELKRELVKLFQSRCIKPELLEECLTKIDEDEYPILENWLILIDQIYTHLKQSNQVTTKLEPLLILLNKDYFEEYKKHEFNALRRSSHFLLVCPYLPVSLMRPYYELNINFNTRDMRWQNTLLLWLVANAKNEHALELLDAVKSKLYCKEMLDAVSMHGTAAIHVIVGKGYRNLSADKEVLSVSNLDLLKKIIELGVDINIQINIDPDIFEDEKYNLGQGNTALHIACARKDIAFINFLLEHGADPALKNKKGESAFDMLRMKKEHAKIFVDSVVNPNNFDSIYIDNEEILHNIKGYDEYFANQSGVSISSHTQFDVDDDSYQSKPSF